MSRRSIEQHQSDRATGPFQRYSLFFSLCMFFLSGCDSGSKNTSPAYIPPGPSQSERLPASYDIADLMDSVTYSGLSFSPDGKTLVTSGDAGGVANLMAFPVAGGEPAPLIKSTDTQHLIGYFPNDDRLLFSADKDGDEIFHLYVRETDGTVKDLTPGEQNVGRFHGWAQDGQSLYLTDSSRKPGAFDVYELSVETYERRRIFQNDGFYYLGPVSPDRRYLALMKIISNRSQYIELYDFSSGEHKTITVADNYVKSIPRAFSPDGRYLYYTTDKWHEFEYLARYHMVTGRHEQVLKDDHWNIQGYFSVGVLPTVSFSQDGKRFAVVVNRDARREVKIFDTATREYLGGSEMPETSVASYSLSKDGTQLAMIVTNGRIPGDIYVKDIGTGSQRRLARSLNEKVKADDLVPGEVVSFKSWDGLTVPGVLYKPHGSSAENKAPAMVWAHGGPSIQEEIHYNPMLVYLVNQGYVVYGVNFRGSSGYGKTFYHLNDHDHGNGDLKDVVAAKQFLLGQDYVDPDRIGVFGQSYGGFMTLKALTEFPDDFDAGVDIYGVSDWSHLFNNRPPWWATWWPQTLAEFGDTEDAAHWREVSPLYQADKIVKPLLVLQGANDPRVLQSQSDEIVEAVRANGVPVEYVVFPDEGHSIKKRKNRVTAYKAMAEFLDKHL